MPRIAILGGGISGLAAAYQLSKEGQPDFVLYEASPRLGGTVETVRHDGFVIECGPDSWVSEKPWARDLAIELGLEAELLSSLDQQRRNYLLLEENLVAMPEAMRMMVPTNLEAIEGSPLFSERARQAYRGEPSRAAELKAFAAGRPPGQDEPVATFVERHFGKEVVEKIAGPLLSGIFGGDIRQLSANSVMAPFVKMEREHGSLIVALQNQQRSPGSRPSVFTSLERGLGSLVDAIAAKMPAAKISLNEPVVALTRKDNSWQVTSHSGTTSFDQVILATPIHITRSLLVDFGAELQALLAIEATSAIVAALAFNREHSACFQVPEGFGFLVPQSLQSSAAEAEPRLLACTFLNQKFTHRAPPGCTLLRAFYGGAEAPKLLAKSDETILALACRQLSGTLGRLPTPDFALVRRWPSSLPQSTVGHAARIARAEAIVRGIPGLHLIGNALHGVGLPDLVRQGRSLAKQVSAAAH